LLQRHWPSNGATQVMH